MRSLNLFVAAAVIAIVLGASVSVDAGVPNIRSGSKTGILILAHGGKKNWDEEVMKVAEAVNREMPTEVAFGMASKRSIQDAIDKLAVRNVERIVAVPLFISSYSSVITSTEYLLGLRDEAPPELAVFAKMDHSHGGHQGHSMKDMSFDPTTPIKSPVPITIAPALNRHPAVADILLSRAASISRQPDDEVVIVVAHGPVSDEANDLWLSDMSVLVEIMRKKSGYGRIEFLTVRDDAPDPVRSNAAAELRATVERATGDKKEALVVPLLLAFGGIEEGIRERLDGLSYKMTAQALLPDGRLADWVLQSARDAAAPGNSADASKRN